MQADYIALQSDYITALGEESAAEPVDTEETAEPEETETTEPEETAEAEEEPAEEEETAEAEDPAATEDEEVDASESIEIYGGTSMYDAVMVPMETKMYGTADGSGLWYTFTTGEEVDATYRFLMIQKTLSGTVTIDIYDKLGTKLDSMTANNKGIITVHDVENLLPNTTYYMRIYRGSYDNNKDYLLIIQNLNAASTGYSTTNTLIKEVGTTSLNDIDCPTNMDDALMLSTDTEYTGTSTGTRAWYTFTTNSIEGSYQFQLIQTTLGGTVTIDIYDELGTKLDSMTANNKGIITVHDVENLLPNTTYYMCIYRGSYDNNKDYVLTICAPEETTAEESEELVFETPFELNSTQVMFVANKATFLDEEAAKAALEPVAEVILAHPDHQILLAGTTATDGTQESCVILSQKRAEAVKNLLVSAFGVPEDQLLTVGLGYEADPFVRGADRDANGNFVESEGAKNRRVVVLDAESDIAKEILGTE